MTSALVNSEEVIGIKKLLDLGNQYARKSSWKDFALVKFCLFSMGVVAGTQIPDKHKKKAIEAAVCVFVSTYVPLMAKVFRIAFKEN